MAVVLVLYGAAAVAELIGLVWTAREVWRAVQSFRAEPTRVHTGIATSYATAYDVSAKTSNDTLEDRVRRLEQRVDRVDARVDERFAQAREEIAAQVATARQQATEVRRMLGLLADIVLGEPGKAWRLFAGPVLLVLGVILGLMGNICAVLLL